MDTNETQMNLKVIYDTCASPFLVRLELLRLFGWSLKLHVFLRSDQDEELHDHPWAFWSLIIAGGYWEQTETRLIQRRCGSLAYRPATHKHRVILANDKWGPVPCATIVLTRPGDREWGFWKGGKFIPWKEFVSKRDC